MIVSDTEGQAVNFLKNIKMELQENEQLRELFGVKTFITDKQTELEVMFDDGERFRIFVKGSEQSARGAIWRNTRPDLIVGDDLENDEIVMNEERRDKFAKWFSNTLIPMGSDNCEIRVVGTILHLDSLLENFMPKPDDPYLVKEELCEFSFNPDNAWKAIRFRAHNEDFSEILWPEKFNRERLEEYRKHYVTLGNPEGYSQEFLNYPIDESSAYFKKRDFLPLDDSGDPEEFYVSADLAISEKKRRAFTVLCVASMTKRGKLRFRDVVRFRGDSLEIIDELFRLQNIYKPECFFIEQENIARTLGPVLNKEMQERGVYLNIEKMTATQDKIKRARALQARMRAGMVEFDTEAEWFPDFQQEFIQFPKGAYMDQVDAAAWIPLGLDLITEAPTKADLLEEEYEQELEETYDFYGFGRNSITGY